MKSIDELIFLLLGEHSQPGFLMPVHNQPELMSDFAASVGQFDKKHPSVS